MYSVNLDLEIITPLFMAGADGRTPELRPPSFKGMMRFWWRAMKAEDDIKKLANEEATIFGGTGEGQGKAKFRLRVLLGTHETGNNLRMSTIDYPGTGYLLYSTFMRGREKGYFKPGSCLELVIASRSQEIMQHALASLWLAIYLGSFGTRSRRGGGNLAVSNIQGIFDKIEDIKAKFISGGSIENFIETGFIWTRGIIQPNKTDRYSNLSRPRILLGIQHADTKWNKALNNIGDVYKKYRTDMKNDLFKGPNFGMPVMHSRFTTRLVGYQNDDLLSDRRSSPLIIKLLRCNEVFFPTVIKLGGNLLPKDSLIMKEEKSGRDWRSSGRSEKEAQGVVDDFLDNLRKENKYTEIKL